MATVQTILLNLKYSSINAWNRHDKRPGRSFFKRRAQDPRRGAAGSPQAEPRAAPVETVDFAELIDSLPNLRPALATYSDEELAAFFEAFDIRWM